MIRQGFSFTNVEYAGEGDNADENIPPTREESDFTFISSIHPLFSQLNSLLKMGYSRPLRNGDLGTLPPDAEIESLLPFFTKEFEEEKRLPESKRSLWRVLIATMGWGNIINSIILGFVGSACAFVGPLLLKAISNHLTGQHILPGGDATMWGLIGLVFVVPSIGSIATCHSNMMLNYLGIKVRNVLTSVVFNKIFKLLATSLETGEVVNIVNVDIKALEMIFTVIGTCVITPAILLCDLLLIYWQIGFAAFVGLSYCCCAIPLSMYLIKMVGGQFKLRLQIGDKRLKYVSEMFQGIRVIKYFAWEEAFIRKIEILRDEEQVIAKYTARLTSLALYIQQSLPAWIPVIMFSTYVAMGKDLDAVQAFVVLQLIWLLSGPLNKFIMVANNLSMAMASSGRVSKFLFREDLVEYVTRNSSGGGDDAVVTFESASFGWKPRPRPTISGDDASSLDVSLHNTIKSGTTSANYEMVSMQESVHSPLDDNDDSNDKHPGEADVVPVILDRALYTLSNVSFRVKRGQCIAFVGPIGAGKTSLLSAMLNELHLHKGAVNVQHDCSLAYHQQQPWIFNASLRTNVLFGRAMDQAKFDACVEASSLEVDIRSLQRGWDTEVGEKGINLSGGQKARISFARALYSDADIYLLDDPLSAVDAHVAHTMFYTGIRGMLSGKTVLLATHQTQFLKDCDMIVVMADGKVTAMDTFADLVAQGIDLEGYKHSNGVEHNIAYSGVDGTTNNSVKSPTSMRIGDNRNNHRAATINPAPTISLDSSPSPSDTKVPSGKSQGGGRNGGDLMTQEFKAKGRIRWNTYWFYISRGKPLIYAIMITVVLCSQVLSTYANIWLSQWGQANTNHHGQMTRHQNLHYLNWYTIFAVAGSCTVLINMNLNVEHRTRAAKYIHEELLRTMLRACISFFDTTPLGRVMNVFSNDIRTLDVQIGGTIGQFIVTSGQLLSTTAMLAYTTQGTFIFVLIPLFLLYSYFQKYFQKSNLELKRLNSIANSPIVSQFTEVLSGITSVRANQASTSQFKKMKHAVVKESTIFYLQQMLDNWKQVRLDISGSMMALFVYILAASTRGFMSPRLLLIAVTYSNVLPQQCSIMVNVFSNLESAFNSVERIKHYVENVKPEENQSDDNDKNQALPYSNWPSDGKVSFQNIGVGYRDGPEVLHGLTAEIHAREKVGVVGLSGSGKSTLIISIFRFEKLRRGSIVIDDVDISKVPLHILRSRIGIIPQDPVLWAATVRFNLDPLSEHADLELWQALESVRMMVSVSNLPDGLDYMVAENGSNFSAGQRQLICFARALLKRPKILILDEATASVDNETDAIIQSMLRSVFRDCTVLTIAHRLNTVLDSDRIMVIDAGNLVEFDSAANLLHAAEELVLEERDAGANAVPNLQSTEGVVFKQLYDKYVLSRQLTAAQ